MNSSVTAATTEPSRADAQQAAVVRISDFAKRYKKVEALKGVSLTVQGGEIYGLIGPDGAGKSSLMKAIAGVLTFDRGTVEVFDIVIDSDAAAEKVKQRIGFMPQGLGLNLYPDLSIDENIDFFARLRLVPEDALKERKQRLLEMTRLDEFRDRPMKNLSGGMKQKLGLICTLIHEPELVILDEPTTGVDPVSRRDFWAILARLLSERGITALVSTAYMDEASRFHRAALLYQGQVLADGESDEIAALVKGALVTVAVTPQTEALGRLQQQFPQVEAVGPRIRVFVDEQTPAQAKECVANALQGLQVDGVDAVEPELEDVFVAKLRHEGVTVEQMTQFDANVSKLDTSTSNLEESGLAIEAQQLSKQFGDFRAVDAISFTVPRGEIFGLLGANGAGKTTAIKMLTGILKPSAGTGQVAGADMRSAGNVIKRRIGYMSQAFSLYLDLTVRENIRLFAGIYGLDATTLRERLRWIVDIAGLGGFEDAPAGSLPMGLRQRLALGCALVHRPQILFLDEPTSGVDPLGRRRFWDILFRLSRDTGVTILITTHYMSEAEHCDHLAIMYAGRIFADDSPAALKQQLTVDAGELLELHADQPLQALELLKQADFEGVALFGKRVHLLTRDSAAATRQIENLFKQHNVTLLSSGVRPLTMEDVFVYRVLELERKQQAGKQRAA